MSANPSPFRLEVVSTPRQGEIISLDGHAVLFVGRGPGVHFALEGDPRMSRIHFSIECNPPFVRLSDANSRHGTFLNNHKIDRATDVRDGDRIRAGDTEFLVRMAGDPTCHPEEEESCPTSRSDFQRPELPDAPLIPGYTLQREIGKGGMGQVYAARRESDGQSVALKIVSPAVVPTPLLVARFQREIAILQRLDHPHIIRHFDSGSTDGLLFFAMELVDGPNAAQLLQQQGKFPAERVVHLGCQLLDALAYAHDQGFVHRDIKPANLLVLQRPAQETLKVADFGLARAYQASQLSGLTISGQSGGTPAFMPPEQVLDLRSAKPPADQYAAAATLYTLLTGQPLYERAASAMELMVRIVQHEPIPLRVPCPGPALPPPFREMLKRALARNPAERFADVRAMRAALVAALPPG